jgi:hypothetical protein
MYGCFALKFCKYGHDVRDTIEPFAGVAFTALGAAVGFTSPIASELAKPFD